MANKFPELDDHFSSSDPQRWDGFMARMKKDQQFREAAKGHPGSDWKLKRFLNMVGRREDSSLKGRKVTGLTGTYRVKYHKDIDRYSCTCPDWTYKRSWKGKGQNSDCKHILSVKAKKRAGAMMKRADGAAFNAYRALSSYEDRERQKKLPKLKKRKKTPYERAAYWDDFIVPMKLASTVKRGKAAQVLLDKIR